MLVQPAILNYSHTFTIKTFTVIALLVGKPRGFWNDRVVYLYEGGVMIERVNDIHVRHNDT